MKRKLLALILALSLITALFCSCGNMSYGLGNFSFRHIHFTDGAGNAHCATVEKWYDSESGGIEVKTSEYGAIFFSEAQYTLFESEATCPYCN